MLAVIPVDIQAMRNPFALQNPRHLHIRVQAHIPIGRSQHNLHLPIPAQEPFIARVRQVIRRIIEVDIVIVIAVEEALDIEGSAHGHARRNHIRMPQGKIQRMITAETAPRHRDLRRPVFPLQIRQKLVDHVTLVLQVPPNPRSRMSALVVPTLAVDAIYAEYLDRAPIQLPGQRADHPCIFILKKTAPGCRKNEDRVPGMPEHQRLHVASQFMAILFVIFAVHAREDCNRTARPSASTRLAKVRSEVKIKFRDAWRQSTAVNYRPSGFPRGLIPKCFSFDCSVVRFNPNRIAAPFGPPICPWLSRKARRMCSRSAASRLSSTLFSSVTLGSSSLSGATSTEPCVRITDRSIKFSNSRTFPGHSHSISASMVLFGMLVIDLFIRRPHFCTKCSTSSWMSSRRSRKGGRRIGNTFNR